MTLNSKTLAALVVAILFGGIIFSNALGWWQTESTKEAAVFTTGEFAGQANPEDIRGSYTFGDVENNFGVPAALVAGAFGVQTDDPASYQVKSLEEMYADSPEEIGTASVRLFVAFYLGLPFDLSTSIYLPESASGLLYERDLTDERTAYLEAHTIEEAFEGEGTTTQPTLVPAVEYPSETESAYIESTDRLVKGKTTFGELFELGVTKEAIESVLGMPLPDAAGMKVKDFCTEKGLSFETLKPALQAEVDQVNE